MSDSSLVWHCFLVSCAQPFPGQKKGREGLLDSSSTPSLQNPRKMGKGPRGMGLPAAQGSHGISTVCHKQRCILLAEGQRRRAKDSHTGASPLCPQDASVADPTATRQMHRIPWERRFSPFLDTKSLQQPEVSNRATQRKGPNHPGPHKQRQIPIRGQKTTPPSPNTFPYPAPPAGLPRHGEGHGTQTGPGHTAAGTRRGEEACLLHRHR